MIEPTHCTARFTCGNGVCPAGPARKVDIYRFLRNSIPFTDRYPELPILLQIMENLKPCYLIYNVLPKSVHQHPIQLHIFRPLGLCSGCALSLRALVEAVVSRHGVPSERTSPLICTFHSPIYSLISPSSWSAVWQKRMQSRGVCALGKA